MSGQQTFTSITNFSLGGVSFAASVQLSADAVYSDVTSVPVAQPSTLSTRTDNTTGTLTMTNSSHGITTGAKIDMYFSGGLARRFVTVGTVSGVSVPFSAGSGDNLPIATTAVVACVPNKEPYPLTVANLIAMGLQSDFECQFTFMESDLTTEDRAVHIVPSANGIMTVSFWYLGLTSNPFTGTTVAWCYMSHGDVAAAHTMYAAHMAN